MTPEQLKEALRVRDAMGGCAFPNDFKYADGVEVHECGLGARDYFAAHAPPPPAGYPVIEDDDGRFLRAETYARWAYEYADAMLKLRGGM